MAFFPRAAEPLAGEDVFRRLALRKTDGGNKSSVKSLKYFRFSLDRWIRHVIR